MQEFRLNKSGRLDWVLRQEAFSGAEWLSRAAWECLFNQGLVCDLRGKKLAPGLVVAESFAVAVNFPGPCKGLQPSLPSASPLWSDEHFGLFQKEAAESSYPLFPWETNTFANRVTAWWEKAQEKSALDFSRLAVAPVLEGGLVQRLDLGTSGAILVAYTASKKAELRNSISKHEWQKTYFAVVVGETKFKNETHLFYTAQQSAKKMRASKSSIPGANAATIFLRTLCSTKTHSLVALSTAFGSRHIVRVTLAALGYPLVGDVLYGAKDDQEPFHLLHAASLEHVGTKQKLPFVPPPQGFLDSLLRLGLEYSHGA